MKKIILSVLSFVMLFGMCINDAFALENIDSNVLSQEVIEIANKYIKNEDDKLIVTNQDELKNIIDANNFNAVIANVDFCNRLIEEKVVGIKDNGSLYIEGDDELTIQGGNINATRLYWWGINRFNDNKRSKKMVSELRIQYKNSKSLTTQVMAGLIGVATESIGATALNILPSAFGGSLNSFANAIEKANKGYGTILAINWVVVGSKIKSQTRNTK